jgi:hypothetical protein
MPGPEQCPLSNIKAGAENEAIEPRTIAVIAIFSSGELYRPLLTYIAIYILLGA